MEPVRWDFVAKCVLELCKQTSPTFWSRDKFNELANTWGAAFAKARIDSRFLQAGVIRWYAEDTTGDRPTPGKIIAAAKKERSDWESTWEGQKEAQERHIRMEDERDRLLAEGKFRKHG